MSEGITYRSTQSDSEVSKDDMDLVLFYLPSHCFDVMWYVDDDFEGHQVERNSTSKMAGFMGFVLISWGTMKQNSVARSTTEVKYVSAAS